MTVPTAFASPDLEGVVLRHVAVPDDLAQMNAIANASRVADGESWLTSDEQFMNFYQHLSNCDLETDVFVAELDGRIVGYGRAAWHDDHEGTRVYEPVSFAHPDAPAELRGAIHDAMESRCRAIAAVHNHDGPRIFESEAIDSAERRTSILLSRGYEPVRWFYSMVRPTLDDLPNAPLPPGLEIREVRPEHFRAIFDAETEAFRDHWGMGVPTDTDYERFVADAVAGEPVLWRVAWAGNEVAGMVRGFVNAEENARFDRKRGYVEHISVRRPWRRLGLARALIAATIPLLRARGMTEAALGVDTQNPSGALQLYESCGFVVEKVGASYRKPLD
ncbi:MAG: mycothiol synthase [Chloroflexota bacterium]|jgi:ribosomal protein S18 acetylase RimI-like enzyme|nr:mycothiol synthase [Chloroflexota bacterium]